jgi:hypothetical protein
MSKKVTDKTQSKGLDVVKLVKKAKELYDEYGETIASLSETLGIKDKIMSTDVEVIEEEVEVIEEEVENEEVNSLETMRSIREEVEADDSFSESLTTLEEAASIAFDGRITNPQEVSNALQTLASVAVETIKYSEEQETKREEIRARRDVAIAQVSAMRDAVQLYLEKSFDERSVLFAKQFECVDAALKAGDNDMLAICLNNINALAASSPFKALADVGQVQKALTSSETEWDI